MSNVELRDLQLYMLDVLEVIDKICKKHDIQYFLAAGTLLGAVRHKGFIPWDDDIDLYMKIGDYFKFIDVCKTELGDEYYLQNRLDDVKSYVFWLQFGVRNSTSINLSMSHIHKPWGICVDIFPLFPYSKDIAIQTKLKKTFGIMNMLCSKYYHVATIKNAHGIEKLKKLVHFLTPDILNKKLFNHYFMKLCNAEGLGEPCWTSYSSCMADGTYLDEDWFKETVELDFENLKMPCPNDWDAYLTTFYKNYMEIPKDKTKHSDDPNVVIKFDECYEKYWS